MIGLSLVGAAGVVHTAYAQTELLLVLALTLSATGILAAIPIFWSLPTAFHTGSAAAAGIGAIAAIGNLGGFAGPAFTGAMEDSSGDFVTPSSFSPRCSWWAACSRCPRRRPRWPKLRPALRLRRPTTRSSRAQSSAAARRWLPNGAI